MLRSKLPNKYLTEKFEEATTIFIIFWDFHALPIFLSPQGKWILINRNKQIKYELPPDLRLRILEK